MMASIPDDRKSRGRPKVGSVHVGVRIPPDQFAALDAWIADQEPAPSRPEAVRRALAEHLRAKGYLPGDDESAPQDTPLGSVEVDRYADADPDEAVMVTGVGPMILGRAVRKRNDWREHHGLKFVSAFRGADKEPSVFDMNDLVQLADLERFK